MILRLKTRICIPQFQKCTIESREMRMTVGQTTNNNKRKTTENKNGGKKANEINKLCKKLITLIVIQIIITI